MLQSSSEPDSAQRPIHGRPPNCDRLAPFSTLLEASCPSGVGDAQQAIPLLRKILLGLVESRIDDTALETLRASIEETRHAQLSAALDAFDFENATEITKKLLSEFGENNE